ncbi:glyoxylase-like metal-dependent hydrolase (beta-lactamase superfamily II) [Amycolatopsis bartoniae]|uniref:MBL fold metallo-hydrolase n=1 Tax=Amycolatopsis bartoniae TaxID=941986 RepID=UPI00118EFED5|nr:MBL fold metallo-hydrolase [Amycolatopsis bartoniae]MBB2939805.1 glyoxylase-like metal-dependent hydrolase (beta-lactamase superfamily II) [Amycolatopsis bartoniae]TVT07486.1 MBL fold metallo-hydrolase [Amycolatopsis bartoniae]
MTDFQVGAVEVTKVPEWTGEIAPARFIIPGSSPEVWRDNEAWLAPDHWHPDTDAYHAAVQTWVLRSEGKTVLVDTGVGNDRDRPQIPLFDHLHTGFLHRLAAAGVRPEDVDVVINTHIHYDHVGWNTLGGEQGWEPAFPNATYLIPAVDARYFAPENAGRRPAPRDDHERLRRRGSLLVYADSVAPVLGRATLWEDAYRVDANLSLEPAPGHTPGSSVLRVRSGGDKAVFVGDILHSPVQILEPAHNSCFCEDREQAAATRRRVLEQAADEGEIVVPAHFAGAGAVEVRRDGSRFRVRRWVGAEDNGC